jgi:hypothetical protein
MSRLSPVLSLATALLGLTAGCSQVLGLDDVPPIAQVGTLDASLVDAGPKDANRSDADAKACGSGAVKDPDFAMQTAEAGLPLEPPWSSEGDASIGLDPTHGPGGTKCGYIANSGTNSWSAILQTVPVTPNTKYVLSAYVQTINADAMGGAAGSFPGGLLGARTTGGTLLNQQHFGQSEYYTEVTVTFSSGNNSSVVIFVGFTGVAGMGAWLHADDFSLCPEGS